MGCTRTLDFALNLKCFKNVPLNVKKKIKSNQGILKSCVLSPFKQNAPQASCLIEFSQILDVFQGGKTHLKKRQTTLNVPVKVEELKTDMEMQSRGLKTHKGNPHYNELKDRHI